VKRAFVNLVLIVDVTELAQIHDLTCDLSHMYVGKFVVLVVPMAA